MYRIKGTNCVGHIVQECVTRVGAIRYMDRHQVSSESRAAWLREIAEGHEFVIFVNAFGTDYLEKRSDLEIVGDEEFKKQQRDELRRQVRIGARTARPEDFPEIPAEDWHRYTVTLRRWGHGLEIGATVCIDPENYARIFRIDKISEIQIEDDDERPRKVTRLEVSTVQINGSYAVLPGVDTIDITGDVIRIKSHAMKKI